jgi:hypothetical protein
VKSVRLFDRPVPKASVLIFDRVLTVRLGSIPKASRCQKHLNSTRFSSLVQNIDNDSCCAGDCPNEPTHALQRRAKLICLCIFPTCPGALTLSTSCCARWCSIGSCWWGQWLRASCQQVRTVPSPQQHHHHKSSNHLVHAARGCAVKLNTATVTVAVTE